MDVTHGCPARWYSAGRTWGPSLPSPLLGGHAPVGARADRHADPYEDGDGVHAAWKRDLEQRGITRTRFESRPPYTALRAVTNSELRNFEYMKSPDTRIENCVDTLER